MIGPPPQGIWRTVLLAGLIASCGSPDGKAAPLGPQPQSRQTAWPFTETWRTPYPTPFGTAGLSGIPPRPSYLPQTRRTGLDASASPGPLWQNAAQANAALAAYAPTLPIGAQPLPVFFSPPYGTACPIADRAVAIDDVESFYSEARRALLAAGFVIEFEDHQPHDGLFVENLLHASSASARAMLAAGRYDAAYWPEGRAIPVTRRYLLRILFTQRCEAR